MFGTNLVGQGAQPAAYIRTRSGLESKAWEDTASGFSIG